jgi:hypothetical protein
MIILGNELFDRYLRPKVMKNHSFEKTIGKLGEIQ